MDDGKIFKITLTLTAALFWSPLAAGRPMVCPPMTLPWGTWTVSRTPTQSGGCTLRLQPSERKKGYRRSFSASDDGKFMVFNDYPGENLSRSTAARIFYLFPRGQRPDFQFLQEGKYIHFRTASPLSMGFGKDGTFIGSLGGKVSISDEINRTNGGGLEIEPLPKGVILDVGFRMGGAAYENPAAKSVFRDPDGKECKIKNSEIFVYPKGKKARARQETTLRFESDHSLADFLKEHCEDFRWQVLIPPKKEKAKNSKESRKSESKDTAPKESGKETGFVTRASSASRSGSRAARF